MQRSEANVRHSEANVRRRPLAQSMDGGAKGGHASHPHAYLVIVSHPRMEAVSGTRRSNEDAIAASLVNMLYSTLGPRQNVVQGLDLRDPTQRGLVMQLLAERGIKPADAPPPTPLLFSARENVFTKPGRISLQLVLDIASQVVPAGPSPEVLATLLAFPGRHDLEFLPGWAAALEAAEAPESRVLASGHPSTKPRTFSPSERAGVSMEDVLRNPGPGAPRTGSGEVPEWVLRADGMETYADQSVTGTMGRAARPINAVPDGRGGVIAGSGGGQGAEPERASDAPPSIESRMFDRMPQIRNVNEQSSISERGMIAAKHGTDEESTKQEILRVRMERAKARHEGPLR